MLCCPSREWLGGAAGDPAHLDPVPPAQLGVRRLVLTGVATDICILFTAADAHMRDYALWVPADAVAAEDDESGKFALATMRGSMGAEIATTRDLSLAAWAAK